MKITKIFGQKPLTSNAVKAAILCLPLIGFGCSSLSIGPQPSAEIPRIESEHNLALADLVELQARVQAPDGAAWASWLQDPRLAELIEEAYSANPSIEAQRLAVKQSRELMRISRATLLPSLDANASARRSATSVAPSTTIYGNDYSLGLSSAWEADIWGRNRAGFAASRADLIGQEISLEATKLSFAGAVAQTWYLVLESHLQLALSRRDLIRSQESLNTVERRYENGLSSSRDLRLSRSSHDSLRAVSLTREQSLGEAVRSLEVLLGRFPAAQEFDLAAEPGDFTDQELMAAVGPVQFNHVLRNETALKALIGARRPDLLVEEARILAASLRYGQAKKALLPTINLTASISNSVDDIGDLLDFDRLAGNILASLLQPIYRGGRIDAELAQIEVQYRLAANSYASALLTAFQEVENAMAAEKFLSARRDALARAADEALEAENLVRREYSNGLATIFELLDAQSRTISAQSQYLGTSRAWLANRVDLHLAFGGPIPTSLLTNSVEGEGGA